MDDAQFLHPDDRVYNLLDETDRADLTAMMAMEKELADEAIARTRRDLELAGEAAAAADRILELLEEMRQLAVTAQRPGADHAELQARFDRCKRDIDTAAAVPGAWPREDRARLRMLLEEMRLENGQKA